MPAFADVIHDRDDNRGIMPRMGFHRTNTGLYLAVLPLVHMSTGHTEQTLTLYPDRSFATEFMPDEVEGYVTFFEERARRFLVGGHVIGYEFHREPTEDGRVLVKVVQIVG